MHPLVATPGRALALAALTSCAAGLASGQSIRFVDASRPVSGDGLSWAAAFRDLQSALAQPDATEIRIAQGVYKPVTTGADRAARFTLRNNLRIRGGYAGDGAADPDANDPALYPTLLSGDIGLPGVATDNSYRILVGAGLNDTAIIENLSITAGQADGSSPNASGSALHLTGTSTAAGPIIRNVRFIQNNAVSGGAIYLSLTAPRFIDCTFANNSAVSNGGALQSINAAPVLDGCQFTSNIAQSGGAMSLVFSTTTLRGSAFSDNLAQISGGAIQANLGAVRIEAAEFVGNQVLSGFTTADGGGAIYLDHVPSAVIVNTSMIANLSYRGGGAVNVNSGATDSTVFSSCSFFENTAVTDGGALLLIGGSPQIVNAVFSGNLAMAKGGAIHVNASNPGLAFCTLFANVALTAAAGGINVGSGNIALSNSIAWSNRNNAGVTEAAQVNDPLNLALVSATCFQYWSGRYPGSANVALAPQFKNAPGVDGVTGTRDDDLRLNPASPAIDAGDADLIPSDAADSNNNDNTVEPVAIDRAGYLRRADAPQVPDTGNGPWPRPDMGAFEYRCPADVNADGGIDLSDFFQFLNDFDAGDAGADIDDNPGVDLADFFAFFNSFDSNCAA